MFGLVLQYCTMSEFHENNSYIGQCWETLAILGNNGHFSFHLCHWSVFSSDHLSLDRENRHKYARTWSWRAVYGTIFRITAGFRNKFYSNRRIFECHL